MSLSLSRCARRASFALVLAAGLLLSVSSVRAQGSIAPPEPFRPIDANGVNLQSGTMEMDSPSISIGPKQGGLTYNASFDTAVGVWRPSTYGGINEQSSHIQPVYPYATVTVMGQSLNFTKIPTTGLYASVDDPAASLVFTAGVGTLTLGDGTVAVFDQPSGGVFLSNKGQIGKLTRPNGEVVTFTYNGAGLIQSITNNFGYQLHFDYDPVENNLTKVTALNNAVDACAPTATTCSFSRTWPSLTFGYVLNAEQNVTDALGRTTRFFFSGVGYHALSGIRWPTSASGQDVTVTFAIFGGGSFAFARVSTLTTAAGTWSYDYDTVTPDPLPDVYTLNTYVTDPLLHMRTIGVLSIRDYYDHRTGRIGAVTDAVGNATTYIYGGQALQLSSIEQPEHNKTVYTYDDRGNISKEEQIPKPGSSLAIAIKTAVYPPTCGATNFKICNKPTSVTDARSNTTTFIYDAAHGGILSVTSPAPTTGAVQPQARTSYTSLQAWYKNAAGVITQDLRPIYLPTQTSACMSLAACAGAADETRSTTTYQAGSASLASNLLPVTSSSGAGDGSLTATTTLAYEATGDVKTVDGPLPGTADTTRSYYDAMRQTTGVIGPDPDGASSLLYRATRTTYAADGQVTSAETGTATSQSDSGMASFVALQQNLPAYDALRRKVSDSQVVGGVAQTLTQYAYDAANRLTCSAVRMYPTATQPASACVPTLTGADGPDRVTHMDYDAADRVIQTTSGYGTSGAYAPRVEKATTYTGNGKEATVADGEGRLTTYEYDGFDRPAKVRYPTASNGAVSSSTDYETYGYDAAGNRTSWRRRDAASLTFGYDALNRVLNGVRGELYAYDNLGWRTSATYSGGVGLASFDALGRATSETTNGLTIAYRYDLAGRRIRITWPDTFFATYAYDVAGEVTGIFENDALQLTAYAYDNLGRRLATYRQNGADTYYGYDAASRLASLALNPAGTGNDQAWTFTYNAAGQVKARTAANAVYEWNTSQTSKTYGVNGLNQLTNVSGTAYGYDLRGNLQNDGTTTYGFDALNNLQSTSGGALIGYEPTGRLWHLSVGSGAASNFLYSGPNLVVEYLGGVLVRRYVPGPGTDEPVVWYEGSGVTDRRYLLSDPQGSIVAATNGAGVVTATNVYDEYGVPASTNQGRFQYTGQIWLPEVGLYHYKARAYSPTLGRFLQTDPIGYGDGLNWYAYVGNDPLNSSDPTGEAAAKCDFGPDGYFGCDYDGWQKLDRNGYDSLFSGGKAAANVAAGFIPGYDLFQCTEETCSDGEGNFNAEGWMALAGTVPLGKLLKLGKLAKLCNCFEAGTPVAVEGGYKPIEKVAVGDLVLSRDDVTGETALKAVMALIPGAEREILDVVVDVKSSQGVIRRDTIHTTNEHPFRTADGAWVPAAKLKVGSSVLTATAASATVVSVTKSGRAAQTYNLEIDEFHTYFVGVNRVWVRNECLSALGRSLAKKFGRPGSAFSKVNGSPAQINKAAQKIYDKIMSSGTPVTRHHARFGNVTEVKLPGVGGVRFGSDGNFIGFLEP